MSKLNINVPVDVTKQLESKNYEIITDMSQKLNFMKGYDVGYSNPKKGN